MFKAQDFNRGERVRYTGKAQDRNGVPYTGNEATVIQGIKSRKVVHLRWDDPTQPTFEARPANLERAQ